MLGQGLVSSKNKKWTIFCYRFDSFEKLPFWIRVPVMHNVKAKFLRGCFLLASICSFGAALAAPVIDLNFPGSNAGFCGASIDCEWQQQGTVQTSGLLTGVTLYGNSGYTNVRIAIGEGSSSTRYAGDWDIVLNNVNIYAGTFIDLSSYGLSVDAGDVFVLDLFGGPGYIGSYPAIANGGLFLFRNGEWTDYSNYSIGFQTFVEPASVPEPMTLSIFGLSLLGFLVLRRKAS